MTKHLHLPHPHLPHPHISEAFTATVIGGVVAGLFHDAAERLHRAEGTPPRAVPAAADWNDWHHAPARADWENER